MEEKRIIQLIQAFEKGKISTSERMDLMKWYESIADQAADYPDDETQVKARILYKLMRDTGYLKLIERKRNKQVHMYRIAAVFLLFFLSMATVYVLRNKEFLPRSANITSENTIKPGGNRAKLILENGKSIELNESQSGIKFGDHIQYVDGTNINRLNNVASTAIIQMETPRGGQYHLILADGTKVWLNAASRITYPKTFNKGKRIVELEGEAYFEVSHTGDRFEVHTANQQIQVLGTKFNVSTYKEEPLHKVTLLDGSVRVLSKHGEIMLKPGQELTNSDQDVQINDVYAEDAIAWKNGQFIFDNETLAEALSKVSKWYDVTVSFENPALAQERIFAVVGIYEDISVVLDKISATGVARFSVNGKKIHVRQLKHK